MAQKVEGWENYETWAVALWMINTRPIFGFWRKRAAEVAETYALADEIKDMVEENMPEDLDSPYQELLTAGFGEVDWFEIAEEFQTKARER